MKDALVIKEFAKILRKYMIAFSLEEVDIAYLANSIKRTISSVLNGTGSLQLETAEAIANSFGLRYYEFGNPDCPIPAHISLPEKTKTRIDYRKREGLSRQVTYTPSNVNNQIRKVLSKFEIGHEFLAEDIINLIFEKYSETYSIKEILNRLSTTFKNSIEKTNRKDNSKKGSGRKPRYYKLVKLIG